MSEMADLILQLRLDSLRKNLEQIKAIKEEVRNRRTEINYLRRVFDSAGEIAWNLNIVVQKTTNSMENLETLLGMYNVPSARSADVVGDMKKAYEAATGVNKAFREITGIIDRIGSRWLEVAETSVGDPLDKTLLQESTNRITTITALQNTLSDLGKASEIWEAYEDLLGEKGRELFGEYVDFLGGFALRNTGFDHGACYMADDVIRRCYLVAGGEWHSMAIPAHREATTKTMARIIRLGFPEWSAWAVPLATHEFGYVVLTENPDLSGYIERNEPGEDLRHLKTYMADAFATYAMGPSYACASILLRLQPWEGRSWRREEESAEEDVNAQRTYIALKLLELLDGDRDYFVATIEGLAEAWRVALEAPDGLGAADDASLPDRLIGEAYRFLCRQAGPLKYDPTRGAVDKKRAYVVLRMLDLMDGQQESFKGIIQALTTAWHSAVQQVGGSVDLEQEETDRLDALTKHMWDYLRQHASALGYSWIRWDQVKTWPSLLDTDARDFPVDTEDDVRDVLNAAWKERIEDRSKAEMKLAEKAQELWRNRLLVDQSGSVPPLGRDQVRVVN